MNKEMSSGLVRKEIDSQMTDYEAEKKDKKREQIAERVLEIDRWQKSLTGRRAEDYARQSGVLLEELFPKGKEILNIGDPWQTLDLEGVTSIDYEFGEEASFIENESDFLETVPELFNVALQHLEYTKQHDSYFIDKEKECVNELIERMKMVEKDVYQALSDDYIALAEIFRNMHELISSLHNNNSSTIDVRDTQVDLRDTWYVLVQLERGFRDSDLMRNIIRPALDNEIITSKLSKEEQDRFKKQLIEQYRFVKKTKYAQVLKATFPDVPFDARSFDRITASWSISTHMFPEMSQNEFDVYWNKIDELLRKDGVAYMWPIYGFDEDAFAKSVLNYLKSGGRAGFIVPETGIYKPIVRREDISLCDVDSLRYTLVIHARAK